LKVGMDKNAVRRITPAQQSHRVRGGPCVSMNKILSLFT